MFPSFDIFQQVFSDITENYGCMVIDNRIHSKDLTKKIFWYKAKNTPNFTMGSKKYKKYHKQYYDNQWNKKLKTFNPDSLLTRKKNKCKVIVEKVKY